MLAQFDLTWDVILVILVVVLICIGVIILLFKAHSRFTEAANRARARIFEGIPVFYEPTPGLGEVGFHTASGVLVSVDQIEHHFWAEPDDARLILARLNSFNLTWGFFAYGALFIPFLSWGNYFAQRSRITRQAEQLAQGGRRPHDDTFPPQ